MPLPEERGSKPSLEAICELFLQKPFEGTQFACGWCHMYHKAPLRALLICAVLHNYYGILGVTVDSQLLRLTTTRSLQQSTMHCPLKFPVDLIIPRLPMHGGIMGSVIYASSPQSASYRI